MDLAVLNTTIMTAPGDFSCKPISLEDARQLVAEADGIDSAVGHTATAEVLTTLLGVEIPTVRQDFVQQVGQKALAFKLLSRVEEGKILTREEIERVGYKFFLMVRKTATAS